MRKGRQTADVGTTTLFVFLGVFPYAGTQRCQLATCSCRGERYLAFRHVGLCVAILCREHADVAKEFCEAMIGRERNFDLMRRSGTDDTYPNFIHPVRGHAALGKRIAFSSSPH